MLTYSWPPFRKEFVNRLINKLIYSLCGESHNLEVPGSSPGWSTSGNQQLRSSLSCWYFLFINKVRRLQNACFSIFFISLFSASLLHETAINHDRICRVVPWPAWSWAIVSLQLRIFLLGGDGNKGEGVGFPTVLATFCYWRNWIISTEKNSCLHREKDFSPRRKIFFSTEIIRKE